MTSLFRRMRLALLGTAAAALVFATTSIAGSGVGDVFNLGQVNTVNGTSTLTGTSSSGPQLKVVNSDTANNALLAQASGAGVALYGQHAGTTGTGPAVEGTSASTDPNTFGLWGRLTGSSSGTGSAAVRGSSNSTTSLGQGVWGSQAGSGIGVFGTAVNMGGTGVEGYHTGSTGAGAGVQGKTASAAGPGVLGVNTADGVGVLGQHNLTTGTAPAVEGTTSSTDANAIGVEGLVSSASPGDVSAGVRGINNGTANFGVGVYGSQAGSGYGVYGNTLNGWGVLGSSNYIGVEGSSPGFGVVGHSPNYVGVYGLTESGQAGVYGEGQNTSTGVYGVSSSGLGVQGSSTDSTGVYGSSSNGMGVYGTSLSSSGGFGVRGQAAGSSTGAYGSSSSGWGVHGYSVSGAGVVGESTSDFGVVGSSSGNAAVAGQSFGPAAGVFGQGPNIGVYGQSAGSAGSFQGNVDVTGDLNVTGTKNFRIDDPRAPGRRFLVHAAVESNQVLNVYSGNVTTDRRGFATVTLPGYFQRINTDFRYQLTIVGSRGWKARVVKGIAHNRFTIQSDEPRVQVSWQVSARRNDPYLRAHPFRAVQEKTGRERGRYLTPGLYGKPAALAIGAQALKRAAKQRKDLLRKPQGKLVPKLPPGTPPSRHLRLPPLPGTVGRASATRPPR